MRPSRLLVCLGGCLTISGCITALRKEPMAFYVAKQQAPLDSNGFLFNPSWKNADASSFDPGNQCGFRARTGDLDERRLGIRATPCFSEDDRRVMRLNEPPPTVGLGLVCQTNSQLGELRGHVNWFPVTATGRLGWVGYSDPEGGEDGDLTMNLYSRLPNAGNAVNDKLTNSGKLITGKVPKNDTIAAVAYHIEFYRKETLRRLPDGNSWWHLIDASVKDSTEMSKHLDKRFAIVNGLFNLDGVHRFHSELHPVYMMAVLVASRARADAQHDHEKWAIMIRNLGNQGDCSGGKIGIRTADAGTSTEKLILDLGWWEGASDVRGTLTDAYTTARVGRQPTFGRSGGRCGCLTLELPRPAQTTDEFTFIGTLDVDWTRSPSADSKDSSITRLRSWDADVGAPPTMNDEPTAPVPARPGFPDPDPQFITKTEWLGHELAQGEEPRVPPPAREDTAIVLTEGKPAVDLGCTTNTMQRLKLAKPECERAWRTFLNVGFNATTSKLAGGLSYYAYPHAFPNIPFWTDYITIPGYRVNFRGTSEHARGGLRRGRSNWTSLALDFPLVWEPSTFRVKESLRFSPYALLGPSLMTKPGTTLHRAIAPDVGLQRGLGIEVHGRWVHASIEYDHAYYFWANVAESTEYAVAWHVGPLF